MTSPKPKVVITGAAGLVGGVLAAGLAAAFDVVAVDRRDGPNITVVDMAAESADTTAFRGADAIVDLAAETGEEVTWERVLSNNVPATRNALETARIHGIPRVVFASSNFVTSHYDQREPYSSILGGDYSGHAAGTIPPIDTSLPPRPITPYAVGKSMGETLCQFYADTHGLTTFALRIGTLNAENRPLKPRHFAKWLSHRDAVSLVTACLNAEPVPGGAFRVYYGVSANAWTIYDPAPVQKEIGFAARDNAEIYR